MFGRFRKGKLLLELLDEYARNRELLTRSDETLFKESKYQLQNNFSVRLLSNQHEISPSKITGFRLNQRRDEGMLSVKTSLYLNEWIDDFKSVDFAEIALFDSLGNISRIMEFDITYMGHRITCEYSKNEVLTPVFDYEIFS